MSDPQLVLAARVQAALSAAFGPSYADTDPVIRPSQFADLQANVALPLAKKLGRKPRDVAQEIVANLDTAGVVADVQVSGPGFINLTLSDAWIAGEAQRTLEDERLAVPTAEKPQKVVVEYSSPNVAKEMHVGHLRTTIVGDAIARILDFLGHDVVRDNHVGDWGTPFGMLIEHLLDLGEEAAARGDSSVSDLTAFYQAAREKFDGDPEFADRSRTRVVKLQAGDPETLRLWQVLVDVSKQYFNDVYGRLGVTLTDDDIRGESFYNDLLAPTARELEDKGIAVISDGALCAFPPGFTGREGEPLPVIIRKSDGGYNYSTTDLATIRYRVDTEHVDRMVYVVGAPQSLHFQMVFAVSRMAGWLDDEVKAEHAQIGNVLGTDGKILRTRAGGTVKLSELLDEAVERAGAVFDGIQHDEPFDDATREAIVRDVAMGAVKYADLSVARDSEYIFDFDRMISFNGKTGPYLQYAAARIRSIFRKGGLAPEDATGPIVVGHPAERALALELLGFGAVLKQAGDTAEPHRLASYIYAVADAYTTFYENCPVLKAPDDETRASRLALCAATLRTLVTGLSLLGVPTPTRM
ncbi:arginine--tRNA ligase [Actinomadura livida]|uniref:Arginine--tRNA ligase n=1 Tax=Actinomadura livida TaxID=79909 RepID=A0A7W7IIV6_9ACTN|nr:MULTISPECIES: arginine--tRNA ligase [Actinomadura]MBB4777902.1 arginyl-tRNA synthetase [Actinomadura catellatispora]GGT97882.1 arginine--tRNA ligase [Actinomadura livida]